MRATSPWRLAWLPAAIGAAVAASVALGAGNAPTAATANPTWTLVQMPAGDCKAPKQIVGRACVDRSQENFGESWTRSDGIATWDPADWTATYKWTVPATIGPAGAPITLSLTALSKTGGRICPAIGVRGIPQKNPSDEPDLGICTQAGAGSTANGSKTVTVVSTSATTAYLFIGLQDGPGFTYKYVAGKQGGCRPLKAFSPSAIEPPFVVSFGASSFGVPDRGESLTLVKTQTHGSGKLSICAKLEARGALASDANGTFAHVDVHEIHGLRRTEALALKVKRGAYNKTSKGEKVALTVTVTKSTDRDCKVGAEGRLSITEGFVDQIVMKLCGANHRHDFTLGDGARVNARVIIVP